ncbi:MAG: geranylgeranylglycerol-phosphate geranylgeranyltransferase [Lentimicrobium sp.]|nr:geranylgeranylglycerol-phosphate geranylgeranyltransferase [Lentimicrobium sp.]
MKTFLSGFLAFFRLVRWPNLLVTALTMYLVRHALIVPVYDNYGLLPAMGEFVFALLVASTVLIAAAGYIINDYFDLRADRINKPDKMVIGKVIHRRKGIILHSFLNVLATIGGFYVARESGSLRLGFIFPMVAMLLWLYSVKYKRMVIWGNVSVAFLSALVVILVWLFEFLTLRNQPESFITLSGNMKFITALVLAYAVFAFLVSMIRELVKDAEDIPGDEKAAYLTFPVVHGFTATRMLGSFLTVATFILLLVAVWWLFSASLILTAVYLLVLVALPLVFIVISINKASSKQDFGQLSSLLKLLMFAGVLSMITLAFTL